MFHIDRSFKLAAVLKDDPRRSNVSRDLARGTDNDLFTTAEFSFDFTVNSNNASADIGGQATVFADNEIIVLEIDRAFDDTLDH